MKIAMINKKPLLDDKLGRLMNGQVVDLPEHKALFYVSRGEAEHYETKVFRENPYKAAGQVTQPSALPVALVLPEQTLNVSEDGAKKKGRPKKEV